MTYTAYALKTVNIFDPEKESPLAGLRIKKITTANDEIGLPIVKNYKYEKDGNSSGLLQVVPEFFSKKNEIRMIQEKDQNNVIYEEYGEYFVGRTYPASTFRLPGSPAVVGYSYVEETTLGNGKTIYEFSNNKDMIIGYSLHFPNYPTYSYRLNGTPEKTTVISSSNDTLSITTYKYAFKEVFNNIKGLQYNANRNLGKSTPEANIYNIAVRIYDIPFGRNYLKEETTTNYYPSGNCFTTKKEYDYNQKNYLVNNIKKWDSRNNTINETIKYPVDYSDNIHTEMTQKHFVNYKIEHIKELNQNKTGHLKINYKKNSTDSFLPGSVHTSSGGNLRTDITCDAYDSKGNIRQITAIDGVITVYLWSYNYQYPIAEIRNATYAEVVAKIAESTLTSIAGKAEPAAADLATVNALRTSLPNALVTTYTYRPLVGILTATDPAGLTTTYEYDSFGRLREVKDHEGKIIENYKYHYNNQ
jgi:YD repeat-containing protein